VHRLLYELDRFLLRITSSRVFSILSSSFCKYAVRIDSTISERLAPRSEHSSTSVSSSSTSSVRTETPILVLAMILDALKITCTECTVNLSTYSNSSQNIITIDLSRYLRSEVIVLLSCDSLTEVDRFDHDKEVVSYAGLNSIIRESGDSRIEGGISKRGSRQLRWILVQCSRTAVHTCQDEYLSVASTLNL